MPGIQFGPFMFKPAKTSLSIAIAFGACLVAHAEDVGIPPSTEAVFSKLAAAPAVKQALEFLRADDATTLADQKAIAAIAAPTFNERRRAEYFLGRLKTLGLDDLHMDSVSNVCGVVRGAGNGPLLLLSAHLDTVFPQATDLTVTERDGKLYAPGIADDARGLAAILSLVRAFKATPIRPSGDVWFCGTVGEEGLGDLKGIKQVFKDRKNIDGYIALESPTTPNDEISYQAAGSKRYRITYKGPGGHSYQAFGLPSANHALGRAVAAISDLQTPKTPKTTFTVGTMSGGNSVNSIAAEATMDLDLRSNDNNELTKLEASALDIARAAAVAENKRWNSDKLSVDIVAVGDRPGGSPSPNSSVVHALWMGVKATGGAPKLAGARSTEANLAISLGVPGAVVGAGGYSQGIHALDEWFDPKDAWLGPAKTLMAILGLVGLEGVTAPTLQKRKP